MDNDIKKQIRQLRIKGLPEEIRKHIKDARKRRAWSQRELGAQTGLPQPHVSAIESGKIAPRFDTVLDIMRILGLDLMIVPRSLVPAVQSLIRAWQEPESVERPLYATEDEEPAFEKRDHDEF